MKISMIKLILKRILLGFLGVNALLILLSFFIDVSRETITSDNNFPPSFLMLDFDSNRSYQKVDINSITSGSSIEHNLVVNNDYGKKVLKFSKDETIVFDINVKEDIYEIAIDYLSLQNNVQDITIDVKIDGITYDEYKNIILPTYWADSSSEKVYDIYQNEVTQPQVKYNVWRKYFLYDQRYYNSEPLQFELSEGSHKIEITNTNGTLLIGDIFLFEKKSFDGYDYYTKDTNLSEKEILTIEGEKPLFKSSPEIRSTSVQETHLTPFSTNKNMLNNLSGDTFNASGNSVTYAFEIKKEGYYNLAVKYYILQTNTNVYSKILVDNVILNESLNRYCFENRSNDFCLETIKNDDKNMNFYFTKGIHTLTFQLDASLQSPIYYELVNLIDEINDLYLEIIKLTGGLTDKNKTWNILQYIPDAKDRLEDWKTRLEDMLELINEVSKTDSKKQNRLYQQINNAYKKICSLANDPNKLPHKLSVLSEGSSSAVLMLSNSLHTSTFSCLSIDKIYIYGNNVKLPRITNNFFRNYIATIQRIVRTNVEEIDDKTINIWVNRSTYYVSIMQQFADAYYTPNSNIKIRFSLLPDESKLIYANASNTQPDAALGVSSSVPYSLGIRGALANLREFASFNNTISNFAPGSLLSYIEADQVYGLPETQDFQVTFYRTDILEEFEIEVPQTYDDIIKILPTLQRYGMNYYMPLAGGSGLKSINITAPFIYQYGGDLYNNNYLTTAIDSQASLEALNMMVDLFSLYSLPLTTQNFYNSFRNGLSPVGISGFDTYMQFVTAAPEIVGKWKLALAPGVLKSDGSINRTQTGDSKAVIIFSKSKMQNQTWDFINWWLSTEVQAKFASSIEATFGPTFLWNTANINAFETLSLPKEDKEIILKQWEYLYQVPQTPATYMIERGISNIWNSCVFNQASIRAAVTDYAIEINREIKRKMIEFKYLDDKGNIIKKYYVPSIEEIKSWQKD